MDATARSRWAWAALAALAGAPAWSADGTGPSVVAPTVASTVTSTLANTAGGASTVEPLPALDALPDLLGVPAVLDLPPGRTATPPTGDPPRPLSLGEAARSARRFSPEVRAAGFRADAALQTRKAAEGALRPRADLRFGAGGGELTSVDPASRLKREEGIVTVRQALFDELNRREGLRQGLVSDAARVQVEAASGQAMLDAAAAWLQVTQAAVALRLGGDYERLLAELLRYVSERAAAGGASAAERDRVRARSANLRSTLAETRAALAAAGRELERRTGEPVSAVTVVEARQPPLPGDPDLALEAALRGNADLRALRLEREAAVADERVQRARFLPRLELEVTHTRNRNASGVVGEVTDTKALVVLSVPVLNGGADLAQVRASAARLGELDARIDGVTLRLRQELQSSYANLEAARSKLASVRDEVASNQRVVEAFQAQLVAGTRPLLEVLDAYQRHHQSRLDLLQVLVAITQNEWRIAQLLGHLPEPMSADAER